MKNLGKWLNFLVAAVMMFGCFVYMALILTSRTVDPRPAMVRESQASAYVAGMAGFVFLFFVARSLREFGYPTILLLYQITASAILAVGAFWMSYRIVTFQHSLSMQTAVALVFGIIGLGALRLTLKLCSRINKKASQQSGA
jgi:uncharacterized membrane protein YdcZ (DUF606 family)